MHDDPVGADQHRVLVYAQLIDPEVWPANGSPRVDPLTAGKRKRTLEAAYRIAEHEGHLAQENDILHEILTELGLDDAPGTVTFPAGFDLADAAGIIAILTGDDSVDCRGVDNPTLTEEEAAREDDRAHVHPDRPGAVFREDEIATEADPGSEIGQADTDLGDPDHDAELGISHVGDADEGEYHEEHV
ncbi:hypothetical protein [Sphingomonas sp. 3-13AW]|uniref:hypothetical protein n=1 Tax=Sphingomonas sp. 3-13AW TaxID=3050450 RepID=UPI003BB637AE